MTLLPLNSNWNNPLVSMPSLNISLGKFAVVRNSMSIINVVDVSTQLASDVYLGHEATKCAFKSAKTPERKSASVLL